MEYIGNKLDQGRRFRFDPELEHRRWFAQGLRRVIGLGKYKRTAGLPKG